MTWHVSQLWAKKELFQQFTLFLTIPLRSRQVQQATCLSDLIPHPDQEKRKAIAQALSNSHGDGVCYWFDGWDELPQEVQQQSFIASFIRQDSPQSSLPGCTIVVTSRSEIQFLNGSSKVDLESLNRSQFEELVVKNTEGTGHDANELLIAIESKAALSRFCSLPVTVTILIHLFFTFGTNIPTTQTELFRCLILNLILRNLQTRWLLPVKTLESFDSLPEFARKCFQFLCNLAYSGVVQNKAVFHPSDVPNLQLPLPLATLGLMRINPHIERFGIDEELTFIHSTVQEFLAAYHLSSLTPAQQVHDLTNLVESDHWPVVIFFGGLTKFSESKKFLSKQNMFWISENGDNFLHLIGSLYEANSPKLCRFVTKGTEITIHACVLMGSLTAADLVPLGYFIVHLCSEKSCQLNLSNCNFSKGAVNSFVKIIISEWKKLEPKHKQPNLELLIFDDPISQASASICELIEHTNLLYSLGIYLQLSSYVFSRIELVAGRFASRLSIHSVMQPLIAALSKNLSIKYLTLKFQLPMEIEMPTSALIAYSEYYAVFLLKCCPRILVLGLHDFIQLDHPYILLSAAIEHNTNLQHLDLDGNFGLNYNDECLENLAIGIGLNESMKGVYLEGSVHDSSLLTLLQILHMCGSRLNCIKIDIQPTQEIQSQMEFTNICRSLMTTRPLLLTIHNEDDEDDNIWVICTGTHFKTVPSLREMNRMINMVTNYEDNMEPSLFD